MMKPEVLLSLYLIGISLISGVLTVYDKIASKHLPRHRIRERTLFVFAALGGSAAMLLTMHLIRHKTKHKRFMIGLPVMLLLQIGLALLLLFYGGDIISRLIPFGA